VFPLFATGVVDTDGKFAVDFIDIGGKFATSINETSGFDGKFASGVILRVMHLDMQISPRIFKKIQNDPYAFIRGLGEDDSQKKPEAKNLTLII
jgi:hypothetical protein